MFLRKTTGISGVENILLRHRTPLRQAIASRNDGVLFFRYHGVATHVMVVPFVWTYQSHTTEYSRKEKQAARSGPAPTQLSRIFTAQVLLHVAEGVLDGPSPRVAINYILGG